MWHLPVIPVSHRHRVVDVLVRNGKRIFDSQIGLGVRATTNRLDTDDSTARCLLPCSSSVWSTCYMALLCHCSTHFDLYGAVCTAPVQRPTGQEQDRWALLGMLLGMPRE